MAQQVPKDLQIYLAQEDVSMQREAIPYDVIGKRITVKQHALLMLPALDIVKEGHQGRANAIYSYLQLLVRVFTEGIVERRLAQ